MAFPAVNTPATIRLKPKVERLSGTLTGQIQSEQAKTVQELQKLVGEADLEYLWRATVEKNPVIRFSLEKLAAPPDVASKQSSRFLTRTLSTLISGASLAATMLPGGNDMYMNMGSMAVGNALRNMISGKVTPTAGSLSATEQIQLAGLIDELKSRLIRSYQDYKQTLESLAQRHAVTIKNNALYSEALAARNETAMMVTGTAYYQSLLDEMALRQKAKLYRLELERLVGVESLSHLAWAAHVAPSTQTAINTPDLKPPSRSSATSLQKPLDAYSTTLPESQLSIIGPQPLIGPEAPGSAALDSQQALQDLPSLMEIAPRLKTDPSPIKPFSSPDRNAPRKALAQRKPSIPYDLTPIEVLHP